MLERIGNAGFKALRWVAFIILSLNAPSVLANEEHGEAKAGKFDPGKMIVEHISDAHEWHLWGHTSIALPVILKTGNGIRIFSSSAFHHDHDAKHVVEIDGNRFVRYENHI